ncbi:hypothetical protein A5844_001762 [Enterococcus sp. 10A9_DIV0425]|uniref:N-acetyltransferase domain-containing protein n=1 Tax=Candidatus Enterococcus wittei TaxID=1987383 RepID=A0A242JXL9_9ENTE|nr:GNAT family N-acetyltransferase [Enterococcus sp. 10A9_DIV0425]OTP10065.1 hypothetical protein A5844_001762 [Enterococcus sp. 10A9_DIV0425]
MEDTSTEKVLGYVHAEKYESLLAPTLFNVLALAVITEAQHHGVGKALMKGLEKEGKIRGFAGIRLNSGETRIQAHQFYEHIGYQLTKWQKHYMKEL